MVRPSVFAFVRSASGNQQQSHHVAELVDFRPDAWWDAPRPAIHGRRLHASNHLPPATRTSEYQGERITTAESDRRDSPRAARAASGGDGCVYIFEINKRHDLDGSMSQ